MMFDYFWSDPHFGHKNIISYCNRPFADVRDMKERLIENYNSVVEADESVLWVGDCFFCGMQEAKEILDSLNGRKFLILGNHDRSSAKMVSLGFEFAVKEMVIEMVDTPIRVSHYPYYSDPTRDGDNRHSERWPTAKPNEVLIHGHTHSTEKLRDRMIHVGVDAWDYFPASWTAIDTLIREAKRAEVGVV